MFYVNLDEKTWHQTKSKLEEKRIRYYSYARNRTVYWYKYIYKKQKGVFPKLFTLFAGMYSFINYAILTILINVHPKKWTAIKAMFIGYKEAYILCKNNKKK